MNETKYIWVFYVENISIYKHFKFLNNDLVRFKVIIDFDLTLGLTL